MAMLYIPCYEMHVRLEHEMQNHRLFNLEWDKILVYCKFGNFRVTFISQYSISELFVRS